MPIVDLDHVQIAMPRGREDEARAFYRDVLGLAEIAKPANLMTRGGLWFALGSRQLHLGVDDDFRAARKAHPAFLVSDLYGLKKFLMASGVACNDDEALPAYNRFYVSDPFGNRLELLEPIA